MGYGCVRCGSVDRYYGRRRRPATRSCEEGDSRGDGLRPGETRRWTYPGRVWNNTGDECILHAQWIEYTKEELETALAEMRPILNEEQMETARRATSGSAPRGGGVMEAKLEGGKQHVASEIVGVVPRLQHLVTPTAIQAPDNQRELSAAGSTMM